MNRNEKPRAVRLHDTKLDKEYVQWIYDIKQRFRNAQIKAAVKVNSEQLLFNWQLGRDLVVRKAEEKWGNGIVEQVSLDLQAAFPEAKGFSARNLWNMKKWYSFYTSYEDFGNAVNALSSQMDISSLKLQQVAAEIQETASEEKLQQVVAEIPFPAIFGFIPWGHHIEIITKCKDLHEALFYVKRTIEEGWSRNALDNCIRADMYHAVGTAVTNFSEKLPTTQGELAQEILKSNYDLGFVSLPPKYDENALEDVLEQRMTRFLLELGEGWAFVGRQKEIIISGKTRKIDLLFYHIYLRFLILSLFSSPMARTIIFRMIGNVRDANSPGKNSTEHNTHRLAQPNFQFIKDISGLPHCHQWRREPFMKKRRNFRKRNPHCRRAVGILYLGVITMFDPEGFIPGSGT